MSRVASGRSSMLSPATRARWPVRRSASSSIQSCARRSRITGSSAAGRPSRRTRRARSATGAHDDSATASPGRRPCPPPRRARRSASSSRSASPGRAGRAARPSASARLSKITWLKPPSPVILTSGCTRHAGRVHREQEVRDARRTCARAGRCARAGSSTSRSARAWSRPCGP